MILLVNATPLIYFAKLGRLDILQYMFPNLQTTSQVQAEVLYLDYPEYSAFSEWI